MTCGVCLEGRSFRFFLQKFYVVRGLNYKDDIGMNNLDKWKYDNWVWTKLLKKK